jgi:hypothetical protein
MVCTHKNNANTYRFKYQLCKTAWGKKFLDKSSSVSVFVPKTVSEIFLGAWGRRGYRKEKTFFTR